jgi:hypothetical protein
MEIILMPEIKYPSGFLKKGVHRLLQNSAPEWARLKKTVADITDRIPTDVDPKAHLKRQKPLISRKMSRRVQRLRQGYRRTYQQNHKAIYQDWRGLFINRRTMLDSLQKTRRHIWTQEITSFKTMQILLSKLTKQLLALRKQIRG